MLKAQVRLALLDCNARKSEVHTRLNFEFYQNKVKEFSSKRKIALSVFQPEKESRMPSLKDFDALILPDSSYTPTEDFMRKTKLGKMLSDFLPALVDSGKYSLCICFGLEAVASSFGTYPLDHYSHGIGKVFNFGYSTIFLSQQAKQDTLFSRYSDRSYVVFAHRYFINELPEGAVHLASAFFNPIAAFKKGNTYCVQWQADMDVIELLKSAEEHKKNPNLPSEPTLNRFSILSKYRPEYDVQNRQIISLFLRKSSNRISAFLKLHCCNLFKRG
ncbi:MAG: hypothetical protein QXT25_03420 [Candidatus Anstonellaceae archaeon]